MNQCCICLCECCLFCIPLAGNWRSDLTKIWVVFWLLINLYIFQSEDVNINYLIDAILDASLELVTYYGLILCTLIMLLAISFTPFSRRYPLNTDSFTSLNIIQCLLVFHCLPYLPAGHYYLYLLSPLLFSTIFHWARKTQASELCSVPFVWVIRLIFLYSDINFLGFLWTFLSWVIFPCTEYFFIGLLCVSACGGAAVVLEKSKSKVCSGDKNKPMFFMKIELTDVIAILLIYGLLAVFEIVLALMHGTILPMTSLWFSAAYVYPLAELGVYIDSFPIHNCNPIKVRLLTYTSILFSFYAFRFLLNF